MPIPQLLLGAAFYVDPPTDIINDGEIQLWRINHIGVDTHLVHFHHINVQVVNRVDITGVMLPPDPSELGWKETVRTEPLTDLIVAFRAATPTLPFRVPQSNRLLDPTMMTGSTANFTGAPPPGGAAAQPAAITNVMTNFGWEFVWHCHLLGHEENDMMRPLVLRHSLPTGGVSGLTRTGSVGTAPLAVTLNWVDNCTNEVGITIQRARNATFTSGLKEFNVGPNIRTLADNDPALLGRTRYFYRVAAWTNGGLSAFSNVVNLITAAGPAPTLPPAPSGLTVGTVTRNSAVLTWTDNAVNEAGFVVERANNSAFTQGRASVTVNVQDLVTYTRTGLRPNRTYYFRVAARNGAGNSAWSNVLTVTTLP